MEGRARAASARAACPSAAGAIQCVCVLACERALPGGVCMHDRNLVDPASSHTLVSKIKPCMSKYKHLYRETANGSLYQL